MEVPLSLLDITLWLAITSITLLTTAEFLSSYYGNVNLVIDKKKLKQSALIFGAGFLITLVMYIVQVSFTLFS